MRHVLQRKPGEPLAEFLGRIRSEPLPVGDDGLGCAPAQYCRDSLGAGCHVSHSEAIQQGRAPVGKGDPFNVSNQATKRRLMVKSLIHDQIREDRRSRCTVEKHMFIESTAAGISTTMRA